MRCVIECGAVVAKVVDFYLDDQRAKERSEIVALTRKTDSASVNLLQGYIREAQRECRIVLRIIFSTDDEKFRAEPRGKPFLLQIPRKKQARLIRDHVKSAGILRKVTSADDIPLGPGSAPLRVKSGDIIYASIKNANLNVRSCLQNHIMQKWLILSM